MRTRVGEYAIPVLLNCAILFAGIVFSSCVWASPPVLYRVSEHDTSKAVYRGVTWELTHELETFRPDSVLNLEGVLALEDTAEWRKVVTTIVNMGVRDTDQWFRISVDLGSTAISDAPALREWVVSFYSPRIGDIEVWIRQDGKTLAHAHSGIQLCGPRPHTHHSFAPCELKRRSACVARALFGRERSTWSHNGLQFALMAMHPNVLFPVAVDKF